MSEPIFELNVDGLVGPTHNYAGLSHGNVASSANRGRTSSPRRAALEGLAKMRRLADLGIPQAVLPPQERPDLRALRQRGFEGSDPEILAAAARRDPRALALCSSASSMWTANAATVAPSADTADGRVHLTVANLVSKAHRAIEPEGTAAALRTLFPDRARFVVHAPLDARPELGDEGAANHTRLESSAEGGAHLFVYGREARRRGGPAPRVYAARQTLEASRAVARLHGLDPGRCLFLQQAPDAIDAGVFHNDVIAVGHRERLFVHERAFLDLDVALAELRALVPELLVFVVRDREVGLDDAVRSYLFNSQIVTPPGAGAPILIAPRECEEIEAVAALCRRWIEEGALAAARYVDLRESMQNGGGPACLRLRVPLTEGELARVHEPCRFDAGLHARLERWVERHYRDRLAPGDLADPALLREGREALDELTGSLELGSFYPFQRAGVGSRSAA